MQIRLAISHRCLKLVLPTLLLFGSSLVPLQSHAEDASRAPARNRVDRGLAFLAKDAMAWKAEHNCSSCHHAALVVWSMNEAKLAGYKPDEQVLTEMTEWLTQAGEGKTSLKRPPGIPKALNTKAVYYALGLSSLPHRTESQEKALDLLLRTVQEDQTDNGSWSSWPETRPPIFGHSDEVATANAALALFSAADEGSRKTFQNGVQWLEKTKSDNEPQSIALRVVLWTRLGRPPSEWRPWVDQIRSAQQKDGGWSQTTDGPSDAWATGQALYALSYASPAPGDAAISRAAGFLKRTQREDGSWPMTSRPSKPSDTGADNLIPITGAGTAWAIMGLARVERMQRPIP